MKKQIALLTTMAMAFGFSAFGQDYLDLFQSGTHLLWDDTGANGGTVLGQGGNPTSGAFDVAFLWAPTGTADLLTSLGSEFGQNASAASDQVATNGVSSTAAGLAAIQTMLSTGGWNIGTLFGGQTIVDATSSTSGKMNAYNANVPFELAGGTGVSGSSIEMVFIAFNASSGIVNASGSGTFGSVADIGWSNPFAQIVGSSAGDANAGDESGVNDFGVAPVPEPTTLALAGLGGLSMLFLRRRKA